MGQLDHTIEGFFSDLKTAPGVDEISALLERHVQALGFQSLTYLLIRHPRAPHVPFYISTYPGEWSVRYVEQDYVNIDPVLAANAASVTPFRWNSFYKSRSLRKDQLLVLNEAREFKINNGVTVPIHGPNEALAGLSVATEVSGKEFQEIWEQHRFHLLAMSYYLHEAILDKMQSPFRAQAVRLSPRERECLVWTARGKTAWEISEILHIAEDTVVQHLKSAQKKFGVYGKTHAVVMAIFFGYIVP